MDTECMLQITSVWLPFIRKQLGEDAGVPVILVGNKGDLIDYSTGEVSTAFTRKLLCKTNILTEDWSYHG